MNNINENIEVSCYCLTYNHAEYIRDALDGFVSQITNFKYQVIVHDDASTDGTAEILQEYAEKYPEIIIPLYETENLYSKGISIMQIIRPLLKGKYIAVCEGDDYWCNPHKLQKQHDILDSHPNFSACVHNTEFLFVKTKKKCVWYQQINNEIIPNKSIFKGGGEAFHTSSLFYRKEYLILPDEFYIKGVGDYPRAIFLTINGPIYYLKDVMSVSRRGLKGSWTARLSTDKYKEHLENIINMLSRIDNYTELRYHHLINTAKREHEFKLLGANKNYKEMIKQYPDIVKSLNTKEKIKLYIYRFFPWLMTGYAIFRKFTISLTQKR